MIYQVIEHCEKCGASHKYKQKEEALKIAQEALECIADEKITFAKNAAYRTIARKVIIKINEILK